MKLRYDRISSLTRRGRSHDHSLQHGGGPPLLGQLTLLQIEEPFSAPAFAYQV